MLTGRNFGRYEISAKIGTGGMGEVYRARDGELGRDVALKVLLPQFCSDEERVKRFQFEARAVSALNHPGIITIHEIVRQNGEMFIATELVDGATLREMIEGKDLDLLEAVGIAEQVAEALAVAHEAKIVHRDIKPENIMVRKDGLVKVLDFGLAKPFLVNAHDSELLAKTPPGLVIGSVRYMSPEQARGKTADGRTDIWSLGVVIYEMVTGKTPFDGETVSDQIAALIHSDPEPLSGVPAELSKIVARCLEKDPVERYGSIKELAADLKSIRLAFESGSGESRVDEFAATIALPKQDTSESATLIHRTISSDNATGSSSDAPQRTRETDSRSYFKSIFAAAAVVLVGLVGLGGWYAYSAWFGVHGPTFDSIQVRRLTDDGHAGSAAVSPDGKLVAYSHTLETESRLLVRQVATGTEVEIVPDSRSKFLQPSFSPDGNFVYYVAKNNGLGKMFRVPSLGGEPEAVAIDVDSRPAVSPDGKKIAFVRHDPNRGGDSIIIADTSEGEPVSFVRTDDIGFDKFVDLFWSADGERILVNGRKSNDRRLESTSLASIEFKTKKVFEDPLVKAFEESEWSMAHGFASLVGDTGLVFVGRHNADETVQIWHLNVSDGRVRPVTTDTSDYNSVSVSADAKVLIATKVDWITGLTAVDPVTKDMEVVKPDSRKILGYYGLEKTSEGKLLFSARDGRESNIYSLDPASGEETRLTAGTGLNVNPDSSVENGRIVLASHRDDSHGLWMMNSDGTNQVQLTNPTKGMDWHPQFINGGKTIVFSRQMSDGGPARLMKIPVSGGEPVELFPGVDSSNMRPTVSNDGKSLAFVAFTFDPKDVEIKTEIRIADLIGDQAKLRAERIGFPMHGWFEWAPSDKEFTTASPEHGGEIVSMPIGGAGTTALTKLETGVVKSFVWSRDGSRLYIIKGVSNSDLVMVSTIAPV